MSKVLVVDDQPQNVRLLDAVLTPNSYEVIHASSGAEALAAVREHAPDLVLLDVEMPGMNGYEVCRRIREDERTAAIPIVALTSSTMKGDREQFLVEGFDGYLQKPITVREFPDQVRSHLRAP